MDTLPRSQLIDLPNELWVMIFYWATYNYTRNISTLFEYRPFQELDVRLDRWNSWMALLTKTVISRTCKRWNTLIEPYLYEEFRFHCKTKTVRSQALIEQFERKPWICPYVKIIVLPEDCTLALQHNVCKILALCPNVQAVVDRRAGGEEMYTFDGIEFPNLQYLDCWNASIALSPQFFRCSRSARVLCLRNWLGWLGHYYEPPADIEVHLNNVDTLKIYGEIKVGHEQILDFPGLVNLVFESVAPYDHPILNQNLPRVRTLEFGNDESHLTNPILHALVQAVNLEELFFHVFSTKVEEDEEWVPPIVKDHGYNRSLKHLGLSALQDHHISSSDEDDDTRIWGQVLGHFNWYLRKKWRFPFIQKVTLYGGEWGPLMADSRFDYVRRIIDKRGVTLEVHPTWFSGN